MLNDEFTDDTRIAPPAHLALLTDKQRKFVASFLMSGNATAAAVEAGYGSEGGKYGSQRGYELMRMQKIRDAITAEQLEHGHALRSLALRVWREALVSHDPKIKLAAAKEIADRFGLVKSTKAVHEHSGSVEHSFASMSQEELETFIRDKAKATKIIDITPIEEVAAAQADIVIPRLHELKGLPPPDNEQDFTLASRLNAEEELAAMMAELAPSDTENG